MYNSLRGLQCSYFIAIRCRSEICFDSLTWFVTVIYSTDLVSFQFIFVMECHFSSGFVYNPYKFKTHVRRYVEPKETPHQLV